MKVRLALAMICVAFGGCAGSRRKEGALRTVGPGRISGDNLRLWLSNQSIHDAEKRPRITETIVWVDGVETPARPRITYFSSKFGWSEHAEFAVPSGAKTARIRATVRSYGKIYTVTQIWTREKAEGPAQGSWKVESDSIELCQEPGKGKS